MIKIPATFFLAILLGTSKLQSSQAFVVTKTIPTSTTYHSSTQKTNPSIVGRKHHDVMNDTNNHNRFELKNSIKEDDSNAFEPPTMAQTHMQGPLSVMGSGKSMTQEELDEVKMELEKIKREGGLTEPVRSFMDGKDIKWRFGDVPDYSLTNLLYLKERSTVHAEGSLEQIVENLVKTWEMERSHKTDPTQHQSVDQENFRLSANGGKVFNNIEAGLVGNYNVLLNSCPANLYDAEKMTWEDSHDTFHNAFAAFPWEVLEVFSGPPKVAFTWRHWGTFTGSYQGNQGKGDLVEVFGFGTAVVNDKLQLQDVEIYYNAEEFLTVLRGEKSVEEANANWKSNHGCPFAATKKSMSPMNFLKRKLSLKK